jgi:hypothetical protein
MITAVSALQACSSDSTPTGPSSASNAPVAGRAEVRVSGTVTDDNGAPVSGVILKVYSWGPANVQPVTRISSGSGFYSITVPSSAAISIFAEKQGYASAWHSRTGFQNALATVLKWDLQIYRNVDNGGTH